MVVLALESSAKDAAARDIAAKIGRRIKGDAKVIRSGSHREIKHRRLVGICRHLIYTIIGTTPGVEIQGGGGFVCDSYFIAGAAPNQLAKPQS